MLNSIVSCDCDWFHQWGLNYPLVWCFAFFWVFALGSCLGSFLNVCIWRMPRGESIIKAPSHCTSCGADIRWYDNLPVISYLVLRGRCRACHQRYTPRYLLVELLMGVLFTAFLLKCGSVQQMPQTLINYWCLSMLCVGAAWIDAEHRLIPDALTYPAMIVGMVSAFSFPGIWGEGSRIVALIAALVSGGVPGIFLSLFALLGSGVARREVLGWGDVKFVTAIGILVGLPGALFTLLAGALSAALAGIFLAWKHGRKLRGAKIAFGPFLAGAALVWAFAGFRILPWYVSWMNQLSQFLN